MTEAEAAKALGIKHKAFGYSTQELQKKADGEKVFPHVFGTDDQGRDIMVRVMVGTRISIIVGVCAAIIVLIDVYKRQVDELSVAPSMVLKVRKNIREYTAD